MNPRISVDLGVFFIRFLVVFRSYFLLNSTTWIEVGETRFNPEEPLSDLLREFDSN